MYRNYGNVSVTMAISVQYGNVSVTMAMSVSLWQCQCHYGNVSVNVSSLW